MEKYSRMLFLTICTTDQCARIELGPWPRQILPAELNGQLKEVKFCKKQNKYISVLLIHPLNQDTVKLFFDTTRRPLHLICNPLRWEL